MNTIEIFNQITDILTDCADTLRECTPKQGADFLSAKDAPISVAHLDERALTAQVQAFREIHLQLQTAHKLAEELSLQVAEPFSEDGLDKLTLDIHSANASASHIYRIASTLLKHLPQNSPQSDLIHLAYAEATEVYSRLQVFVRKAKPKGILPPINRLNKLK